MRKEQKGSRYRFHKAWWEIRIGNKKVENVKVCTHEGRGVHWEGVRMNSEVRMTEISPQFCDAKVRPGWGGSGSLLRPWLSVIKEPRAIRRGK